MLLAQSALHDRMEYTVRLTESGIHMENNLHFCCDCAKRVTARDKVGELYVCDSCWENWIMSSNIPQINYEDLCNPFRSVIR